MRPRNVILLAALLALASFPIVAVAQETTATLTGRVMDPQGLGIPGVTVTVTGGQGSKTAVTDNSGRFQVPYLVPGPYTVKAELQGFKTVTQGGVALRLGQTLDVPLTMQVGGVTETVNALEDRGLIRGQRGSVVIMDRAGLERSAGRFYGAPEAEYRRLFG